MINRFEQILAAGRRDLDARLTAAAARNRATGDCNARPDCAATRHLLCCPKGPKA